MDPVHLKRLVRELKTLPHYASTSSVQSYYLPSDPIDEEVENEKNDLNDEKSVNGNHTNCEKPPAAQKEQQLKPQLDDEKTDLGFTISFNPANLHEIAIQMEGPPSSPYEDGLFMAKLVLDDEFPRSAPKGFFTTKIFHPNISPGGEICVNTLKSEWSADTTITKVILTIKCLLLVPNPESSLNEEAGRMLMEDYDGYCRHARLMTKIHALHPRKAGPPDQPPSLAASQVLRKVTDSSSSILSFDCSQSDHPASTYTSKKRGPSSPPDAASTSTSATASASASASSHLITAPKKKSSGLRRL